MGAAAFRDLEAEGVADGYLGSDKRRDELPVAVVLDTAYRPHILEDGFRGMEVVPQSLLRVPDMPHIRGQDQRHEADEHPSVLGGFRAYPQTVFAHRIGLRGSVLPSPVVVDTDLVYRTGFGRSAWSHGYRYKY